MGEKQQSKRIFVIEQEAFLARIICRGLKRAGFDVKHIATGEAALVALAEDQPDYLIVATDMHPMSGEEFCRRLQSELPDRDFPVFVMSDFAQDLQTRWSHWFSNFRMMGKPVSLRFIIETIDKLQGQAA